MSHLNSNGTDLTHADWWMRSIQKLLQSVDTNLRCRIVKRPNNTQHLHVANVSEETLSKLFFLVNTDQNNNYGYLEFFHVFTQDDYSRTPIEIPGVSELANGIWDNKDAFAFVNSQKTETPFLNPLYNPITNEPLSFPQYVDLITAIIPWLPKTLGKVKIFELVLNPDDDIVGKHYS